VSNFSFDAIDRELFDLLEKIKFDLRKDDCDFVRDEIKAGEPGLALETICTQLVEYDAPVTEQVYLQAKSIALMMQLPEETWLQLRPLVGRA
jgi:hypothetical protein